MQTRTEARCAYRKKASKLCAHQPATTNVVICKHVAAEESPALTLLVSENGIVDFALCERCAQIDDPSDNESPFVSYCAQCADEAFGVPAHMPTNGEAHRWTADA